MTPRHPPVPSPGALIDLCTPPVPPAGADGGAVIDLRDSAATPEGCPPRERPRVLVVMGTRPEAIKLAPVARALADTPDLAGLTALTGQHDALCREVLDAFGLVADVSAAVARPGQGLAGLTARVVTAADDLIDRTRPAAVVVQGDTTTAFGTALAAFYRGIPVVHVEAGLRTGRLDAPWPEEANRRLIADIATLHLAPTPGAAANLLAEGVEPSAVRITGNTVVDALRHYLARPVTVSGEAGRALAAGRPVVLVTTHRRESWGAPERRAARALAEVARRHPDVLVVVPMHPNPVVRGPLREILGGIANVELREPLPYPELVHLLARTTVVVTDSGGIQEEAATLGVPVLILRDVTERPEVLTSGVGRLVGTDPDRIREELDGLLGDPARRAAMSVPTTAFGDGRAALRCVHHIRSLLGTGDTMSEEPGPDTVQLTLEGVA